MRDGAIHYQLYLLKLKMAVDNIVFRIIKGAFYNNNNKSISIAPNQSRLLSGALQNIAN